MKVLYGESHRFFLKSRAEYLYFESNDQSSKVPLWTRSKPSDTKRGQYDGYGYFTIEKLTQADNGKYTIQSRFNTTLETNRVDVSRECAFPAFILWALLMLWDHRVLGHPCPLLQMTLGPPHLCGDSTNIQSLSMVKLKKELHHSFCKIEYLLSCFQIMKTFSPKMRVNSYILNFL